MSRFAIILLFIGASFSLFGQQALSDNVNGQWCIYSNGERINLAHSIHELGNFDEVGLSFFMQYEKYGIINEKGKIILKEEYNSIKQLGGGYYLLLNKEKKQILANWKDDHLELREISKANKLEKSWYKVSFDSTELLINMPGQKEWKLTENDKIIENDFNYVFCEIDNVLRFFDPIGNDIIDRERTPNFTQNYLLIYADNGKKIVFRHHEIDLPNDAKYIRVREKEIMYSQSGKTTIISAQDGKVISVLPYDDVSYYNDWLLTIRKNNKVGLAKKSGEIIVPVEYNTVTMVGDFYHVRQSTGVGIVDKKGKQLLPCQYSYVVIFRDFFEVHSDLEFVGLISRKTGKTLLPVSFSRLTLNDSIVRGFTGDMMRILKLDTNHRIINDIVMSNVISLVNTRASDNFSFDERLLPLGWFFQNIPKYDSLGFLKDEIVRWGLKGANDSILIKPRLKEPIYIEQADFSLIIEPDKEIKINGFGKGKYPQFQVASHITGKRLIPENVFSIDTLDLLSRSYARFVSEKGRGVLRDGNSVLRVDYIDEDDTRFVRYCTSKNTEILPALKTDFDAVRYFDFQVNNESSQWLKIYLEGSEHELIRYNNAEWNFLDTNGKTMFTESFDFAQPYLSETALVTKGGKWGVARADSLVIPMSYASVDRSPISDTLFVVKRKVAGTRYLDTNGRVMSNGMTRFLVNKDHFAQIEIGKSKKLIAPDYSIISGDTEYQKLFDNGIYYGKEKKEFPIYDKLGHELGSVKLKPEEVWFERYVLAKSRGKFGVLSMDNDTVIPFQYKKIEQRGNYIFAQNGAVNLLYDENLKLVDKLKENDVLVDPISNNYAEISFGKAKIFSSDRRKIGKFKGNKFDYFHNGYLIEFGKTLIVHSVEKTLTFEFQPREFEIMGENGYFITDASRNGHYFNSNWEEITFDVPLDKVKMVGNGMGIARGRDSTLLFGGDDAIYLEPGYRNLGNFANGFLLLERNKECIFVDENGINHFKRTFSGAEPFLGKYATVKEKDGWTIIDKNGYFQILPGFEKIEPVSKSIFSTAAQPVYGLFDSHGNQLIPVEFQQLNFLRNDIIQARKDGDIFYFDRNGKPILLD